MGSEANELVDVEIGTIRMLDIDGDFVYSAYAVHAAKKRDEGEYWTFQDFVRQALLTYAGAVR